MGRATFLGATRELLALCDGPQSKRLLRLDFPSDDAPRGALMLVNQLVAHEEVSRDFRFEVEILSDDARIPLKAVMGRMVTVSLVREDGTLRFFNGYVTEFRLLKADGGYAWYNMILEPWLAFLRLRQNCMVFHQSSIVEITEAVFAQYRECDWTPILFKTYPRITCAIQYNESDHNHLNRRWEELGIHYWYEHREDGHTLCLGDRSTQALPIDGGPDKKTPQEIAYRKVGGADEDDGIHEWQAVRRLGSGMFTVASFDYKHGWPELQSDSRRNPQGDVRNVERFEDTGAYGFQDYQAGEALAALRMADQESKSQYFEGKGNHRMVQAGRGFVLSGHFSGEPRIVPRNEMPLHSIADREYLVLSATHTASNNYHLGQGAHSRYENRFRCVRQDRAWVPARGHNSVQTRIHGLQTAIIVGPANYEIHTDEYGRAKAKFHWDRVSESGDDSSAWMRVASAWAGNEMGVMALPRVGQEVIVQFMDGNPDRPIITGRVFNTQNMPPWELSNQQALMGIRSRELGSSGRSNQLILDDAKGAIQAHLKSDHLQSQLSLGHIGRFDGHNGRTKARGEGFALESEGAGAIRSLKGLLISTDGNASTVGGILNRDDLITCLEKALKIAKDLSASAEVSTGAKRELNHQEDLGAAVASLGIGEVEKGGANQDALPNQPLVAISAAAGFASSTPKTHINYAGKNIHCIAGENQQHYAAVSISHTAGKDVEQFAREGDIRTFAAKGNIVCEAQQAAIEITAAQLLTLSSAKHSVRINADKEILLCAGGSYLRINAAGIEHGTNGNWISHAARHEMKEPAELKNSGKEPRFAEPPRQPIDGPVKFKFRLQDTPGLQGEPYPNTDWRIVRAADHGTALASKEFLLNGRSNNDGYIELDQAAEKQLSDEYNATPSELWLVAGSHARELVLVKAKANWCDEEKFYHGINSLGYADEHGKSNGIDVDDFALPFARQELKEMDGAALFEKIAGEGK